MDMEMNISINYQAKTNEMNENNIDERKADLLALRLK